MNFELIFIEFFEYGLFFRINRIANFRIEQILNEFQFDSTPNTHIEIMAKLDGSGTFLEAHLDYKWPLYSYSMNELLI